MRVVRLFMPPGEAMLSQARGRKGCDVPVPTFRKSARVGPNWLGEILTPVIALAYVDEIDRLSFKVDLESSDCDCAVWNHPSLRL